MFPEGDQTLQQRLQELKAIVDRQDACLRERGVQSRRLADMVESYRGQARVACAQAAELRDQLTASRHQVGELTARLAAAEAGAAAAAADACRAGERLAELAGQLEQAHAEHRRALDDVHREVQAREKAFSNAIAALDAQVSAMRQAIAVFEGSRSWRLTAPIRGLRRAFDRATWQVLGALSRAARGADRHAPIPGRSSASMEVTVSVDVPILARHTAAYAEWQDALAGGAPAASPTQFLPPEVVLDAQHTTAAVLPEEMFEPQAATEARTPGDEASATTEVARVADAGDPRVLSREEAPAASVLRTDDAGSSFHAGVAGNHVALTTQSPVRSRIGLIAFYESRFYPTPLGDLWWGRGFTDWAHVARGRPRFAGHEQPHLPGELGFYDLRVPGVLDRQIELARLYGVRGFCFRYYWFSGERLLEGPLDQFSSRRDLDFPFCLCWDHEPLTREWDAKPGDVLIAQGNHPQDAARFFHDVEPLLGDPRYIRVEGRPLVVVQHPERLADPAAAAGTWRALAREAGLGELLLLAATADSDADPRAIGFDAVLALPARDDGRSSAAAVPGTRDVDPSFAGRVRDYGELVERSRTYRIETAFPTFRCVARGVDEEARRPGRGFTFAQASPGRYQEWLEHACRHAERHVNHRAPFVFVQSWNGWADGSELEPDQRHGYAYLQATADALRRFPERSGPPIICVSHDAQFSGAQLLLLNLARVFGESLNRDVELLLCGDGPLRASFGEVARVDELYSATSDTERIALIQEITGRGARSALCNTAVVGEAAELLHACGVQVVSLVHELPGLIRRLGAEASAEAVARAADVIICAADIVRDRFVELAGPPRGRVLVRAQGLYLTNAFKGRRADARREVCARLGIDDSCRLVIGAGYGDRRKGFDLFVEAGLRAAHAQISPMWRFVWLGDVDPALLADAMERITKAGREALFVLPGFVRHPDAFFAAADAFLLTSREDPFPSVVLEALDVEVPVIAFAGGGGFVELLDRGCGVLVPDFDPAAMAGVLAEVLADPASRTRLARAGRRIMDEEFSFLEYARYLLRLLSPPGPRISVIVPNYNYERYLPVRLRSILAQTCALAEIIFLDDASTDDSVAVAESILSTGGIPYRIIVNDRTAGCYQQWLRGLREATGDLVWIAEADDSCEPTLLSTLLPAFERPDIVLAYCQSTRIDDLGRKLPGEYLDWMADISTTKWRSSYVRAGVDEIRDSLIVKNTIPNVSAVLMRKPDLSAIAGELVTFRNAGDWLAYVHILEGGNVAFFPDFLNHHRRHAQGITEQGGVNLMRESLLVQQRILQRHIILPDVDARRDQALQNTYQHLGLHRDGPPCYRDHEALRDLLPRGAHRTVRQLIALNHACAERLWVASAWVSRYQLWA